MKAIRVVGCILAALQFLISVFLVYMLYVTKLVPFKIMVIVAVVLALLPIIVVIMMKGKKSALVGMLLSVIMSGVLCYGIYFIGSTNKALDDVTGNNPCVAGFSPSFASDVHAHFAQTATKVNALIWVLLQTLT